MCESHKTPLHAYPSHCTASAGSDITSDHRICELSHIGDSIVNSAAPAPITPLASAHPLSAGAADSIALEQMIEAAREAGIEAYCAGDREAAREHFADMAALIRLRTPERVREMEQVKGLR